MVKSRYQREKKEIIKKDGGSIIPLSVLKTGG
jgi:hypothetical protein